MTNAITTHQVNGATRPDVAEPSASSCHSVYSFARDLGVSPGRAGSVSAATRVRTGLVWSRGVPVGPESGRPVISLHPAA